MTPPTHHTYEAVTRDIRVRVFPAYMDEQSAPEDSYFFWAYTVDIVNEGNEPVQLQGRYWHIVDATGRTEEVRGPGVVGQTPVIAPGTSFTYTSGCPLKTPSGLMSGRYQMTASDGTAFDVQVPAFSLDSPFVDGRVN